MLKYNGQFRDYPVPKKKASANLGKIFESKSRYFLKLVIVTTHLSFLQQHYQVQGVMKETYFEEQNSQIHHSISSRETLIHAH